MSLEHWYFTKSSRSHCLTRRNDKCVMNTEWYVRPGRKTTTLFRSHQAAQTEADKLNAEIDKQREAARHEDDTDNWW